MERRYVIQKMVWTYFGLQISAKGALKNSSKMSFFNGFNDIIRK